MGNRTNIINKIREKKNHIVQVYTELDKNNSSSFDALAVSYGKKLSKIISKFGPFKFEGNFNKLSNEIAIEIAKELYQKEFIPMQVYSSICTKEKGVIKQQIFVVIACKNVDRKRKFSKKALLSCIGKHDLILLDVKEREILPIMADVLDMVEEKHYKNQVFELLFKTMPTLSSLGKKQTGVIMQELRISNPEMYSKLVEMEKKVAQSLFLYETTIEQLLLNDAIEEFQTKLWKMPVDVVQKNQNGILTYKSKADKIESIMNKNQNILKKVETKSQRPKKVWFFSK